MPKHKQIDSDSSLERHYRPALTEESREKQLESLAIDLVEQRLRNGTASSAETVHFLKLASTRNKLEMELMKRQIELTSAKRKSFESSEDIARKYDEAIKAMKIYQGSSFDSVSFDPENKDR